MPLSEAARAAVREALAAAPRGGRTALAERLAARYGLSRSALYAAVRLDGARRPRAPARPEYREWARVAAVLRHMAPAPVPLEVAIEAGIAGGDLPPEAASMPLATAYRVLRDLGLAEAPARHRRLHADWPMQALLIDGSTSAHLTVGGPVGEDWELRLHRRPWRAGGYKNKPLGAERLRLTAYGVWDMCTGYALSRYAVARGEAAWDAMDFLCWACGGARAEDPRVVMHGVPDDLWSDLGPLARSAASRDLLDRLGIRLVTGPPYAKARMGGVERVWRTQWSRFERSLYLRRSDSILLSELNARVLEHHLRESARRASRTPVDGRSASRAAAWSALHRRRPADRPLRAMPADPIATMAQEARRWVDAAGVLRWRGEWECADLHSCWVVARRPADGSEAVVAECERTGRRTLAVPVRRRPYGVLRTAPATPLDRLLADPPALSGADVHAPAGADAVVVPMPARSAPPAPLDDPLDADALPSLDAAMEVFGRGYPWPLSPGIRARIEARLLADGLSRRAAETLAAELSALAGSGG